MNTDQFGPTADGYVPDPERDTAAIVEGIFAHIAETLTEHGDDGDPIADMRTHLADLEAAAAHRIVDEPARYNLRMTLALVVAYRRLEPRIGRPRAVEALRAAFVEPLREFVGSGTRAMLDAAPNPFAAMVAVSKVREEQTFGVGFTFDRPVDDDRAYHVDVVRCFYHDVLVEHSAPELTPVMCEFDRNWIDAIDPDRHGFRFERTTTIGLGGSHCPFHFDRVDT